MRFFLYTIQQYCIQMVSICAKYLNTLYRWEPMRAPDQDNHANNSSNLTQAEIVRIGLETDILSGRVQPGSVIDETETSRRYGVSRTPVREAILLLVQAGLIQKEARRRAVWWLSGSGVMLLVGIILLVLSAGTPGSSPSLSNYCRRGFEWMNSSVYIAH